MRRLHWSDHEFRAVLYSADDTPLERTAGFSNDEHLDRIENITSYCGCVFTERERKEIMNMAKKPYPMKPKSKKGPKSGKPGC